MSDDGGVSQPMEPPAPTRIARGDALLGVLAGALGASASVAAASLARLEQNPVVAVAGAVRDLLPRRLAVTLVHLVGHLDKPLLLTGTVIGMLALAGFAGVQVRRRAWLAYLVLTLTAGLAGWAVGSHSPDGGKGLLPVVVGWLVWLIAIRGLVRLVPVGGGSAAGRRSFLAWGGATLLVSAGLLVIGEIAGRARRQVEEARRRLRLDVRRGTEPRDADLGISPVPWRIPADEFYRIDTAIAVPAVTPDSWSLRIHGMVERPIEISYQDLVSRTLTEDWITLCCVSNEVGGDLIGNAFWSGVPVRELLALAGVRPGADAVKQTSVDGWTCGTPLEALTDPHRNALLAVAMNGAPLPIEHGFPVRMVVPGLYGYVSATKWVVDLEVTRFADFEAYWTKAGWAERGPVKTESRVDVPRPGEQVRPGRIAVAGSAWAQHVGIARVEFQVDGGRWQQARLGGVPNDDTWVQWAGEAEVAEGEHEVRVRATDKSGYTQTAVQREVLPDGATGWHTVLFRAG